MRWLTQFLIEGSISVVVRCIAAVPDLPQQEYGIGKAGLGRGKKTD
jgi:hypothetical protein